ncbi:class II aldolase/adducin family protein [Rhodococcus sp. IEGM 1343]|uniref:class II aldolase/adducin family protein n=1 Tax=Rhodococcus sp. IEGM 1343 TaxID=3082224 RepID=UPI002953CA0F|nr:class II aldolase/adducin family protein [Rhodococcus sp. IEGM 1343]MDV8056548.1 class II aldolase/adducin family protein [Rhodococcus sp. IEGM 1343]
MPADVDELRQSVATTARQLGRRGLVLGTAGNVSARTGDVVAVTATGLVLADATIEDVTVVGMDAVVHAGACEPTSELGLHLGIYASSEVRAVVHAHSSAAVALSLVADELPPVHYAQLALGGTVPVVPFAPFGTTELADAVVAAMRSRSAVIMAHHGSVATGRDLDSALSNIELLEWLCGVYLSAAAVATPRTMTEVQLAATLDEVVRRAYGTAAPVRGD